MSRRRVLLIISVSIFFALASMLWRYLSTSRTAIPLSKTIMPEIFDTVTKGEQVWKGVIVVGSGLAGLSAASELIAHNVPVHMLERFPKPGGNSIKASSGINGAPTRFQTDEKDTAFYSDTVRSAGKVFEVPEWKAQRQDLISTLTNESKSAIDWLVDEKGVDLSVVSWMGGHSRARTHRGSGGTPPGASLVFALLNALKGSELFQLETECVVTRILRDEVGSEGGDVTGVEYEGPVQGDGNGKSEAKMERKSLYGPVIVATGGFAGDSGAAGMLTTYRPDLTGFPSTNTHRPGSQSLLTSIGGQLIDMEQVQVHPTAFIDPVHPSEKVKFLAAEMLRGEGGLMLYRGKRFVNELGTRKVVTDIITALPSSSASTTQEQEPSAERMKQWDVQLVLDEAVYARTKSHVDFYIFKGLMRKTTIADLGEGALDAIREYAAGASGKQKDTLFGRMNFGSWALLDPQMDSVVIVGSVTPATHFTMGGVVIDKEARVVERRGKGAGGNEYGGSETPIPNLWAAGEITGGVHGENRLGGSSLLECVVFGRRAGKGAARAFVGVGPAAGEK